MPRNLLPPADGTAERALLLVQTATTRVKERVSEGIANGWSTEKITEELNKCISDVCKTVDDDGFREQLRRALVTAARKWHYELTMTYRILNDSLTRKAQALDLDITAPLRSTPFVRMQEFRKVLDEGTNPGIPVIKDYWQSVRLAVKAMSADPPKVYMGSGRAIPVRLRAEMAVRYAAAVENLQSLIDGGVKFCWISSHSSCSPRCAPYQGKLYSLFQGTVVLDGVKYGERGTIDGIPYRPINEALAGSNGDGNGCISGYNCRHRAIEYQRGSRPPQDYTEAQMKKEYAVDRRQRAYENNIRQLKTEERQLRAMGMTKDASDLRKKWRRLTKDYEIYSLEHGRAFYRYRCAVDSAELQSNANEDLTEVAESGTISNTRQVLTEEKVDYREVQTLSKPLTEREIIDRIGGGDKTVGSCSSVALAYIGNKIGLDVLDFRGGRSRDIFASPSTISDIATLPGVNGMVLKEYNDFSAANQLLRSFVKGKEYYFAVGEHAAIARLTNSGYEYLELQDPVENGYKPLTSRVLDRRFGCKHSYVSYGLRLYKTSALIECDSLKGNQEFKKLLGYLNTASVDQRKGKSGTIK